LLRQKNRPFLRQVIWALSVNIQIDNGDKFV